MRCPVINDKFRHNIVKVSCRSTSRKIHKGKKCKSQNTEVAINTKGIQKNFLPNQEAVFRGLFELVW